MSNFDAIGLDHRQGRVAAVVGAGLANPQRRLRKRSEPDLAAVVQWNEGP